MKKKSKKIIALTSAILVVLVLGIGGGTYAKYASSVDVSAQLSIAKWSFKVNDSTETKQTINLADTLEPEAALLSNGKIAPGTHGEFIVKLDATGTEVGLNYKVEIQSKTEKPKNLVFTCDGREIEDISEVQTISSGQIFANQTEKTRSLTIGWKWNYETSDNGKTIEQNDIIDTQDAQNIENYTFDVIVTGSQLYIDY